MRDRRDSQSVLAPLMLGALALGISSLTLSCTEAAGDFPALDPAGIERFDTAGFSAIRFLAERNGSLYVLGEGPSTRLGKIREFDVLLVRYGERGSRVWLKNLGTGNLYDTPSAIAVNADGTIYLAGKTPEEMPQENDAFVARYDADGTEVWRGQFGTPGVSEYVSGIRFSPEGNVYVAGTVEGRGSGSGRFFLARYDTDGSQLSLHWFGAEVEGSLTDVAFDVMGDLYAVGTTRRGGGMGDQDGYIARYDPSGGLVWIRQSGRNGIDRAAAVALDEEGFVYVAGVTDNRWQDDGVLYYVDNYLHRFSQSSEFDATLSRYDADGHEIWTRRFGTGTGGLVSPSSLSVDRNGDVNLAGMTKARGGESLGFVDATRDRFYGAGPWVAFMARYDRDGNEVWSRQLAIEGEPFTSATTESSNGTFYIRKRTAVGQNAEEPFLARFVP